METLQDFVSARFADLTAATGLTDWARQVVNAVTSAASSVRGTPSTAARRASLGRDTSLSAATCRCSVPASSAADIDGTTSAAG